jgi:hypothetical protein
MNEFKIMNNIGSGSFSKVKKVLRVSADQEDKSAEDKLFAMKVCTKPPSDLIAVLRNLIYIFILFALTFVCL